MKLTRILIVCFVGMFATSAWAQEIVPTRATGDVTGDDGEINLTDVIYLLNWLYNGGPAPELVQCGFAGGGVVYPSAGSAGYRPEFENGNQGHAADVNGDESLDITDAIALLNWLFLGGTDPEPMVCVAFGDV